MKKIIPYILFCLFMVSCVSKQEKKEDAVDELLVKAREIYKNVITLDTHIDIDVKNFTDSVNYSQRLDNQVNLPKMKEGGLDVAWFVVYTRQDSLNEQGYKKAFENAMSKFDAIHRLVNEYAPDEIEIALTSDDVRKIHAKKKKVAMIGVENGYSIGTDLANIKKFYDLGARYMSLAHQGHSQLADSNSGENDSIWLHNGLSELGKQTIAEMNKYGIMVDLSHPSKEANIQAIKLSKAPVIASHSSARALCDNSRNLDDEVLELIRENNGVVHAVALSSFVNAEKAKKYNDYRNEIAKKILDSMQVKWLDREDMKKASQEEIEAFYTAIQKIRLTVEKIIGNDKNVPENVAVADFVDHIDYLVKRMVIDHVGIGSDFDGGGGIEGWNDASETFNVTLELMRHGYTENEISKLWSENLLRVLDDVQKVAQEIQHKS